MIVSWVISATVLGALIAIGASFVSRVAARLGVPRRWPALALMTLSVLLPATLAVANRPTPVAPRLENTTGEPTAVSRPAPPRPVGTDTIVLIIWASMSLGLVGVLALSHRRGKGELAACTRCDIMGTSVAVSPDFGPAAVGLIRTQVILPEWVLDLPPEELQLVLRHEFEHVRAGDQLVLFAAVIMTVLMPWNVGLWWQLRRLRVAMELDCDARVTPSLRDRPRYAQLLLRARTPRPQHRMVLALAPAPSALAERLTALLDRARPSPARVAAWSASALACALMLTRVPVPSLRPAVAPATPMARVAAPRQGRVTSSLASRAGIASKKITPIHRRQPPHTVAPVAETTPPHPRYDSLVPYVPGPPDAVRGMRTGMARGTYIGGARGSPAVGATRAFPQDSTQH